MILIVCSLGIFFGGVSQAWGEALPKKAYFTLRLDDVTFTAAQKDLLERVWRVAEKHGVPVVLGVVAEPFERSSSPEVFSIYQNHPQLFEIAAHGWDHRNVPPAEFYNFKGIKKSRSDQEERIRRMVEVFRKKGIPSGEILFVAPWDRGDESTVALLAASGYRFAALRLFPLKHYRYYPPDYEYRYHKSLLVSRAEAGLPAVNLPTVDDFKELVRQVNLFLSNSQDHIQIVTHPRNYDDPEVLDRLISMLRGLEGCEVHFERLSDRIVT